MQKVWTLFLLTALLRHATNKDYRSVRQATCQYVDQWDKQWCHVLGLQDLRLYSDEQNVWHRQYALHTRIGIKVLSFSSNLVYFWFALLRSCHSPIDDNAEHRRYLYNRVDRYWRCKTRAGQLVWRDPIRRNDEEKGSSCSHHQAKTNFIGDVPWQFRQAIENGLRKFMMQDIIFSQDHFVFRFFVTQFAEGLDEMSLDEKRWDRMLFSWFLHEDIWRSVANDRSAPWFDYFSVLPLADFRYEFWEFVFHEVRTDEISPTKDQQGVAIGFTKLLTPGKDSCSMPQYCLQFRLIMATIRHEAVFFDETPGTTRPVSS